MKNEFQTERRNLFFDYDLQVWVKGGIILMCEHPESMKEECARICNQYKFAGKSIDSVKGGN